MSDSSTSFWKLIAVFLFIALAGVYALYDWYGDRLKAEVASKDAVINQCRTVAHDADERRLHSEEARESIRNQIQALKAEQQGDMQSLKARHQSELDDWAAQVERLKQEKAQLELAMDGLKGDQAVELDTARQKIEQVESEKQALEAANAELEKLYEGAHERAIKLKNDLDKVNAAIAKAAEEHQAKIAELEQHLNERVNLARTTPMDADLVRAARDVGVLPVVEGEDDGREMLTQQLQEAKAALESLTAEHAAAQEQLAETQAELERSQSELEGANSQLAAVQDSGASAEAAAAQLTELRGRLTTEQKVRTALQQQHEAAITALQAAVDASKTKLAASSQELEQARAGLGEAEQAMSQRLDEAQSRIQSLETQLAQARTDASAPAESQDELQAMGEKIARLESELEQARKVGPVVDGDSAKRLAQAQGRISALEETLDEVRNEMKGKESEVRAEAEKRLSALRELYAGYAELGGTYTPQGVLVRLAESELRFPPGQAELPSAELPSLNRVAKLVAQHPDLSVRVEGHTDSSGGADLNLALSQQRAEAVRQALIARGVGEDRIIAAGLGSERPIADNGSAQGRGENRRVEVYLLD